MKFAMSTEVEECSGFLGLSDDAITNLENNLIVYGFRRALAQLYWLLPSGKGDGEKKSHLQELVGGMDSDILHDILLDASAELRHDQTDTRLVKDAVHDQVAREVIQRNQQIAMDLMRLLASGITECNLEEPDQFKTISKFIEEHQLNLKKQAEALVYKKTHKTDAQLELEMVTKAATESRKEMQNTLEAWRLQERRLDNQAYETTARVDLEIEHINDFTEHQLHYLAFSRERVEQDLQAKRLKLQRETEFAKVIHRSAMELLNEAFDLELARHENIKSIEELELSKLTEIMDEKARKVEDMEGELASLTMSHQHNMEVITHLLKIRSHEIEEEEKLARYMNAVVRIQRWWRSKRWQLSKKKKKKKKGAKGSGKKGTKGKGKKK